MRGMKLIASAFAAALLPVTVNGAAAASDPVGIWMNDTGRGAVEIKKCGNTLCGHVVWVKDESDNKGCGKQIIGNVASVGGGKWDNGWIYSPERGRRYNVEITPLTNGTLRVTGYAGMKFLSKTMIWKRAPSDLARCDTIEAKAAPAPAPQAPEAKSAAGVAATTSDITVAANANDTSVPVPPSATAPQPAPEIGNVAAKTEPPAAPEASAPLNDETPAAEQPSQDVASAEDDVPDIGKTLNSLGLGKVVSKTKSGKCKLDLPWVKVTIDCER